MGAARLAGSVGLTSKELRREIPRQRDTGSGSEGDTGDDRDGCAGDDHADHLRRPRAKGDADADLARAADRGVIDHAVQVQRRQEEGRR